MENQQINIIYKHHVTHFTVHSCILIQWKPLFFIFTWHMLSFFCCCCLFHLSEVMEVPGKPLSESNARKYFIDVVLGIEYCKWDYVSKDL